MLIFLSKDIRRKTRVDRKLFFSSSKGPCLYLALACFKTRVRLINYVYAAFASNNSAISVSSFKRFQRICNFHNLYPNNKKDGGTYSYVAFLSINLL